MSVSPHERHYVHALLAVLDADPEAQRITGQGVHWNGERVGRAIRATRDRLRVCGARPGMTVAILTATNHPLGLIARHGAHLAGASVVHLGTLNPGSGTALGEAERLAILRDSQAGVLIADATHAAQARRLSAASGAALPVLVLEPDLRPNTAPELEPILKPPAIITCTSGSTARPKVVLHSFDSWNRLVLEDAAALAGPGDTFLVVTPLSHTVAVLADIALLAGGRLVLHEKFEAGRALADIEEERVTRTYLSVPQLYQLLDHPDLRRRDLSSLRHLVYSGCPAAPARMRTALEVFPRALVQSYGSTEAGRITLLDQLDHHEPELLASVGRPFPGVEVRICDPSSGGELATGEEGEVWVRSEYTMTGYLADPDGTRHTLREGWLRTGDVGRWDRYGYLHLVGRLNRVVKTGGVKVHPTAVEQALLTHPAVADCAVFSTRDPDELEYLHAVVVLHSDPVRSGQLGELHAHLGSRLPAEHLPRTIVSLPEIPLTQHGKPDLHRLRNTAFCVTAPTLDESELSA